MKISAEDDNRSVAIVPLAKGTLSPNESDTSDNEQEYQETTTITSDYGFKYHKEHGFTLNEDSQFTQKNDQIEYFDQRDASKFLVGDEKALVVEPGKQTLIVRTVIHSENQEMETADGRESTRTCSSNMGLFDRSHSLGKSYRSQSTSCLLGKE